MTDQSETRKSNRDLPLSFDFEVDTIIQSIRESKTAKLAGWPELDALGVKFHPKELALIAARTGHGKTTAILNLVWNWLDAYPNESLLLYSCEVPIDAVFIKLLSMAIRRHTGEVWPFYAVKEEIIKSSGDGSVISDPNIATRLNGAIDAMRSLEDQLIAVYCPHWTMEDIWAHAKAEATRRGNVGAILIDYLQLIRPSDDTATRADAQVALVARSLKRLSVEIACPVVAAAQMSRMAAEAVSIPSGRPFDALPVQEAIKARRPQLHHLSAGASEQEADLVLGLLNYRADFAAGREDIATEDRNAPGPLDVCVLKNRYGNLGIASLVLEGQSGNIRGLDFRRASVAA